MQHHHLGRDVVRLAVLHAPQQMLRAVAADAERARAQVAEVALPHRRNAVAARAEAVLAAVLAAPRLGDTVTLCVCSAVNFMTTHEAWIGQHTWLSGEKPCVHCCAFGDVQQEAVRLLPIQCDLTTE